MAWPAFSMSMVGLLAVNLFFLSMRSFARSQGLNVRWWSRGYAAERKHLRMLAGSADQILARRARRYLRFEIVAWSLMFPLTALFLWSVANELVQPAAIPDGASPPR